MNILNVLASVVPVLGGLFLLVVSLYQFGCYAVLRLRRSTTGTTPTRNHPNSNATQSPKLPAPGTTVAVNWDGLHDGGAFSLDLIALPLGADGSIPDEGDVVFFNQMSGLGGAIVLDLAPFEGDNEVLRFDLDRVPARIRTIAVGVALDGPDGRSLFDIHGGICFSEAVHGNDYLYHSFYVAPDDRAEVWNHNPPNALVLGELHRTDSSWSFEVVRQPLDRGMVGILSYYGIRVYA